MDITLDSDAFNVNLDNEVLNTAFHNLMDLFIIPEIKNRQKEERLQIPFELRAAQVIFFPDDRPKMIRLNEEVRAEVRGIFKPGILKKKGDPILTNEIGDIQEVRLTTNDDPDCAHVFIAQLLDKWFLFFDFRYNRGSAKIHVDRANEFIDCAEFCFEKKHWGALVDTLFSASELLATTILLISPVPDVPKKPTII